MNKYILSLIVLTSCSNVGLNVTTEKINTDFIKMTRTYYSINSQIFIEDDGYNIIDITDTINNNTTYNIYFKFIKYIDIDEEEFTIGYAEFGNYPDLINVHSFNVCYYDSLILQYCIPLVYEIPNNTYFSGTLIQYISHIQQYTVFQDLTENKEEFINNFINLFQPVWNIDWQYDYQI